MMTGFERYTKKTRRAIFLEEMEQVVPWAKLCGLIEPHYPKPGNGRLALAPTAMASSKWYVDGVNGSDNNDCKSRQHACKTIGHAISLASSGDSILVAAATYTENLTIGFSLKVIGSGAATTIIDGGQVNSVVTIPDTSSHVTLSKTTASHASTPARPSGMPSRWLRRAIPSWSPLRPIPRISPSGSA